MANAGLRMSVNEKEFIEAAIKEEQRIDGRTPFDYRKLNISFLKDDGSVEVQLGQTRVLAVVKGEITQPYPDRGNEGSLSIFTEFSPMGDPGFEVGRPSDMAVELGRIIDRGLRESRAVDTESLCILSGRSVWAIRVDIHILDNCGNLIDAANLAALAALLSYRRPECTVGGDDGQQIIVHPPEEREPVGLIIHHLPVAVTFAFFGDGNLQVVDPNLKEEEVMGGRITITMNSQGDVCAVQKGGGVGVSSSEIMRCLRIAAAKAQSITETLKKAVEVHDIERAQRKIRRHRNVGGASQIDTAASAVPNDIVEKEEAMDEEEAAPEAAHAMENEEEDEEEDEEEEEGIIKEEPPTNSNPLKSTGQTDVPSRSGGRDYFAGGESAWGDDMKLTPLRGAPGNRNSIFDSSTLVGFEEAARAMIRGGAVSESQRMSTKLVSAPLQRQISGQIAAAAVYANQTSNLIGDEARSLGPIFPRVADTDMAVADDINNNNNNEEEDVVVVEQTASGTTPLSFLSSGKKKAKKRKSGQGTKQV